MIIAWVLKRLNLLDGPAPDPDTDAFRDLLREQREAAERETRRLRALGRPGLFDDSLLPRAPSRSAQNRER